VAEGEEPTANSLLADPLAGKCVRENLQKQQLRSFPLAACLVMSSFDKISKDQTRRESAAMHETPTSIQRLVDLADARLYELVGLMKPVMASDKLTIGQRQTISWLSTACVRASGSALLLAGFERVWDAEILSRSVFEGTVKFCHLLGDPKNAASRFDEYEISLSDIASLADHEKARRLIEIAPDPRDDMVAVLQEMILTEEKLAEFASKYPRQERRRIQAAWGFTGIVEQMVRNGEGLGELAAGLLHGYAMASHVAHADYLGIGMVMEREHRPENRRIATHEAHAARVISDQLWYCAFRLIAAYRFIEKPRTEILDLMTNESELSEILKNTQADWYRVE
jgi:hypothetical protein